MNSWWIFFQTSSWQLEVVDFSYNSEVESFLLPNYDDDNFAVECDWYIKFFQMCTKFVFFFEKNVFFEQCKQHFFKVD